MKAFVAAACLATGLPAAEAVTIYLAGPDVIFAGDTFQIHIVGDFEDVGFIAGGVQFEYDAALFSIIDYTTPLSVDPALSCPGASLCPADPAGIMTLVWGQFLTDLVPPGAGPVVMGSLTATASPDYLFSTFFGLTDISDFTGGWFGAGLVPFPEPPTLIGLRYFVPLPGALVLMLGGIATLLTVRRARPATVTAF